MRSCWECGGLELLCSSGEVNMESANSFLGQAKISVQKILGDEKVTYIPLRNSVESPDMRPVMKLVSRVICPEPERMSLRLSSSCVM